MNYKTYRKLDQLCFKYLPEGRYDYCGAFCNNTVLDRFLAGNYTKQDIYKQFLKFVFDKLLVYSDFKKVLEENKWFKILLIKYGHLKG